MDRREFMQYIEKPKAERQQHINLDTDCTYGGNSYSRIRVRRELAKLLGIDVPKGHNVHCCHACNDSQCGNLLHLYFGTPSENKEDGADAGSKTTCLYLSDETGGKLGAIQTYLEAPSRSRLIGAMVEEYYDTLFPGGCNVSKREQPRELKPAKEIPPEKQEMLRRAARQALKSLHADKQEALLRGEQNSEVRVR